MSYFSPYLPKCALLSASKGFLASSPKVLKNKKADGAGIKTGVCPGGSAHGALKACGLLGRKATTSFISLGRKATTSFISLQRQLFGLLAKPFAV